MNNSIEYTASLLEDKKKVYRTTNIRAKFLHNKINEN